nr:tail fiber domain-containing protein [Chitinophagaceae bacterium]
VPVFAGFGENIAGNADHILAMASNVSNARSVFLGRKARGTLAAPAAVQNNDYLLSLFASGYDGSTFQSPATIDFFVDGKTSSGNVPARISLSTGSSFGNRTERLKVGSTGNVDINNGQLYVQQATGYTGMGTTAPANRLHVKQTIANKAIEWQHETLTDFWTVGIGTNTLNCRFEFNGVLRGQISSVDGSFIQGSDRRLKQDIEPMQQLLDKVRQLKPSTYYYKDSRSMAKHRSVGFIAQEIEDIFPELVYEDDGGFKMLNYSAFSVIAIKVIQEQQQQIDELEKRSAEVDSIKAELAELRQMILGLKDADRGVTSTLSGYLDQNTPNPGNGTTTITYHVGGTAVFSKLIITNTNGQVIKTIQINNRGTGQLNVDTHSLSAGVYNYTLYVDSKRADSKQLIIVR